MTHPHRFLTPTWDPDLRRCSHAGCKAVSRVAVTHPAPAVVGSATSEEAARRIEPSGQQARVAVWQALLAAGDRGLTDEQLQEATGLSGNSERPRRGELVADNLVEDTKTTRLTHSRRRATVWRRTQAAQQVRLG